MHIKNRLAPGTVYLGRVPDLSKGAKQRLKWFDYYQTHGQNAALTCRYFGISRQTFYRWLRRYDPQQLPDVLGSKATGHTHLRPGSL